MNSIAFDAHKFVKELVSAGMPEPQAEVLEQIHYKFSYQKRLFWRLTLLFTLPIAILCAAVNA